MGRLIDERILTRVRTGTCAVGYLTVEVEDYVRDLTRPFFKIVGTGFMVRNTTIMTNRHVIEAVEHAQREFGFADDRKFLQFVYPRAGGWQTGFCRFLGVSVSADRDLDFAFIEFEPRPEPEFAQCRQLDLGSRSSIAVGQPIAMCGYPYGTSMLLRDRKVYRFGPVLQQGYIAAVAPYDTADIADINDLLLDIRAADGMSGSPVFDPDDARVVGLLYASWEATTGVAIPLDAERVSSWLAILDPRGR